MNCVIKSFFKAHRAHQLHMSRSRRKRNVLFVSTLDGVTAVAGVVWRVVHGALHSNIDLIQLFWQLRLIANKDVIIHGLRDVVYVELKVSTFWNIYKAHTSPCRAAIQRIRSRYHSDTRSVFGVLSLISVVI